LLTMTASATAPYGTWPTPITARAAAGLSGGQFAAPAYLDVVGGGARWAEPEIDLGRGEVRGVLEEFTGSGPGDVRRVIAAVPPDGSAARARSALYERVFGFVPDKTTHRGKSRR
jgi:hypothetical protein